MNTNNPWDTVQGDYFAWHYRQVVYMKFMLLDTEIRKLRRKKWAHT